MVTVYIGPVDKYEPIPKWTGLAFDSSEVIQRMKKKEKRMQLSKVEKLKLFVEDQTDLEIKLIWQVRR